MELYPLFLVYQTDNEMVHESTKKIERNKDKLSPSELKRLKNATLGHGNLKGKAGIAGIKTRTLERICLTGVGLSSNIAAIRQHLL